MSTNQRYVYDVTVKGRVFPKSDDDNVFRRVGNSTNLPTKLYNFRTVTEISRTIAYYEAYTFMTSVLRALDTCENRYFCSDKYFLDCTKSGGFKNTVKVDGKQEPNSKAQLFCVGQSTRSEWLISIQRRTVDSLV